MKFTILLSILFDLLYQRKLTANYLSEKYDLSPRTIYRYIDVLSVHLPLQVQRGRNGGIILADNYKLPCSFMTAGEYECTVEALSLAYAQTSREDFLQAKRKLSAQSKADKRALSLSADLGNFFADSGIWGDIPSFGEKMRVLCEGVKNHKIVDIVYENENGEKEQETIEPHAFILHQNIWLVVCFCHGPRLFRAFRIGEIFSVTQTDATFRKRPFLFTDIYNKPKKTIFVSLEITSNAYERAQNYFGVENLKRRGDIWQADLLLPDDKTLIGKILVLGEGVKILQPKTLKEEIRRIALQIAKQYE